MANDRLFQFQYAYQRDMVDIHLKVSIGASGAPTIVQGKGVSSISRTSAGLYVITLKSNFNLLMDMSCHSISGSSAPAAPNMNIVSETVSSTKIITMQLRDIAAAAADPASGEVLMISMKLRNAST
jgi:hypothetical protein